MDVNKSWPDTAENRINKFKDKPIIKKAPTEVEKKNNF